MSAPFEVLFSITVYRDGQIRIGGHGREQALPGILRIIAEAIEAGAVALREEDLPSGLSD